MADIYDCDKCIHNAVCGFKLTKEGTYFKEIVDKLSDATSENMNVRISCRYYEEVHYHGTTK